MAKRKRKILFSLGMGLLVLALVVAALPLWFPWVLRPLARQRGLGYSNYERVGYTHLALRNVTLARGIVKFEAKRVETLLPTVWLWRVCVRGGKSDADARLRAMDWHLEILGQPQGAPTSATSSAYAIIERSAARFPAVEKWLPKASFTNGSLSLNGRKFRVPSVDWDRGKLSARIVEPQSGQTGVFTLRVNGGVHPSGKVMFKSDSLGLNSQMLITEDAANLQITGAVFWRSNRFDLTARFGRQGWLPEQATVISKSFQLPATALKLPGYGNLSGSLDGQWQQGRFAINLNASATPLADHALPPVQAVIRASGDTRTVTIERATLSLPWASAALSAGIQLDYQGRLLSQAAVLRITADLSKQSWAALTGSLSGQAVLRPGANGYPALSLNLSGTGLGNHALQMKAVTVVGQLSGPWRNPDYSAHVEINRLSFPELSPLKVQADLRGEGLVLDHFQTQLSAGSSSLLVAGSGRSATNATHLRITTLDLIKDHQRLLTLEEPATVSWQGHEGGNPQTQVPRGQVEVVGFHWRGPGRELNLAGRIDWPARGNISSSGHGLNLTLVEDYFPKPLPRVRLSEFSFLGTCTNGPVFFHLGLAAQLSEPGTEPLTALVAVAGDEAGLTFHQMEVSAQSEVVIAGQGFVPLTIEPAQTPNIFNLHAKQPINFSARTRPNAWFWNRLAALAGIQFREPRLDLAISGTPAAPQGKLSISAKAINIVEKRAWPGLRLEDLTADLTLTPGQAKLDQFQLRVQGQPVSATGQFPLARSGNWRNLRHMVDWERATGQLKAEGAKLAPFASLFPGVLAPQGKLDVDLVVQSGMQLSGNLILTGAATQPLAGLGALLDIAAQIRLAGRHLIIQTFTGFLGGGRINVSGGADLAQLAKGQWPQFEFRVSGENVPLVREPDAIVRSDVNITLSNARGGEPILSGALALRNSFYLRDLADLIPGQISSPQERPPFFSVTARPFADWRVDLWVSGTNFLKARTPYFVGGISANFQIHGTLREPVAVGDATIASGTLLFPFSSLEVKQGLISLFSGNPFMPQLFITAAAKVFGYDVHLEVTGPASQPKIQFTSTPPLTSEQILLMVTAGVLPEGESGFTTQQRAQRLALFLGKSFLSKFGAGGGAADRLTIRSGEYLTEQGGQTYSLEYKLSPRLSIVGEYDRFAELAFSLKWKVYSK